MLLCFMLCMASIPAAAFADGIPAVVGNLDLTSGNHADKTLAKDGYEWDSATNTLTIQDLAVTGDIILPKLDCTINVKGECSAQNVTRNDSGANQATLVKGVQGASFKGYFDVAGNLTFTDLTVIESAISNGNVGAKNAVLKLENSNVTLTHLSWMTNSGIDLVNSSLTVVDNGTLGQFWTEKITMDDDSVIESFHALSNYGNVGMEGFHSVQDYIAMPKGGSFVNIGDRPVTIADKSGMAVSHFILKAPAEKCQIDLKASPAEGGTVSGAGEYDCDTRTAVKAEANKGYHFVRWEDWQGNIVSKDAAYSFTVKETTTLTAVFAKDGVTPAQPGGTDQNTDKGTAPKTGDNAHPVIWIALLAVSVLGIAAVAVFGRKHASQKK